ncbi:hypothetical protein GIB67_032144 [Kingdonia uniflora]|uniref:Uncharacterized protein n=1 Tax=Kingdonia uniflora TaxID=39325 RepID=A0A7J7MWW8_9MAGN|nr:hypothetical protein GIB67_032144 [Kingdonia uniflora]
MEPIQEDHFASDLDEAEAGESITTLAEGNRVLKDAAIHKSKNKQIDDMSSNAAIWRLAVLIPIQYKRAAVVPHVKLAGKEKARKEQRETFQGKFDDECANDVRLKIFIEEMGYDHKTLKCFPTARDPIAKDVVQTRGLEMDIAGAAVGGGVEEATAGTETDEVGNATVSNPSTKGTRGLGVDEQAGGDGVATLI